MTTIYNLGAGVSPYTTLPGNGGLTDAERALYAYFAPYAADKTAVLIDVARPSRYKNLGGTDDPSGALLLDSCGGRVLTPEPVRNGHPHIVTVSGKPALCFGAGGGAPNGNHDSSGPLDSDFNGALYCPSILMGEGESNDLPLFKPGLSAWCGFAKFRCPTPSTTNAGISFGSVSGGAFMGGRAWDGTDDEDSFWFGVNNSNGFPTIAVRASGGSTLGAAISTDVRDGATHTMMFVRNVGAGTIDVWLDAAAADAAADTHATGVSGTLAAASAAKLLKLGAYGDDPSGAGHQRFVGFIFCAGWLPSGALVDSSGRLAALNYMAER